MEPEMIWLWALASGIALWFAWGAFQWVRAGLQGAPDCGGREIEPGTAYRRAVIKGAAALAVPGCVAVFAVGGGAAWAIAGPPVVILFSYVAERRWHRSSGLPST